MVTHLEKIETKRYSLDELEISALRETIETIVRLEIEGFSPSEFYTSFDSVIDVLNAIIENNSKKLEKNDDTGEFELETED